MSSIPPPGMMDLTMPPPMDPNFSPMAQIPILQSRINAMKEQIQQSEKNLKAQFEVFEAKKKVFIFFCVPMF